MKWSELIPAFVLFAVVVYSLVKDCISRCAIKSGRYLPFGKKSRNPASIIGYIACIVWVVIIEIDIKESTNGPSAMGWVWIVMAAVFAIKLILLSVSRHAAILTDDRVLFFNCGRQWWKYSNIISAEFKADDKVLALIHVSGGVQGIDVRPEDVEPVKSTTIAII